MKDSRNKTKEIEDKYNKYKKDISNERMFLFRINNLFTNEFDELIEDILILNETQFFIQIKNRVEAELEEIYSEKIFSDQKFGTLIEKGINYIKHEYNKNLELINNAFNNFNKSKTNKNEKNKLLTSNYRRHCVNEVDNEFATHNCSAKLGKIITVENKGKIAFLVCANCKKVYYDSMILCKCYKCNIEYYTEILPNNEDEFILPATWDNYHCKQITKEKIKCIKCREIMYINLKTNMLQCLNKNCNLNIKPNKILWTCSICNQDFKSGAMPYNPLELEVLKKVIKQTLYLKQHAHPNKVPCCKVNVFFTEFHHKKKCEGVLYTGELNQEVIIVCEKCHAVNFYERFIWTCPKCGNKFKDENNRENSISEETEEKSNTLKSNEDKKKSEKYNLNEDDASPDSNSSKNKQSYERRRNKSIHFKETSNFNLGKNINLENLDRPQNIENDQNKDNEEDASIKKTKSTRFKRKLNNINYEREKEKKEKEQIDQNNNKTEITDNINNKNQIPNNQKKRSRFFSSFENINFQEQEQVQEKDKEDKNNNEQKRKIEKTPLNIFNKFRKDRNSGLKEQKDENNEQLDQKGNNMETKVNKKNENIELNKEKEKIKEIEIKKNYPKSSKRMVPYRSFKRNTAHNIKEDIESLNILNKEKKEEEKEKEKPKENVEIPKRVERKRFLSNNYQANRIKNNNLKNKILNEKNEDEEEELEEVDLNTKKRNKNETEQKQETKKEENGQSFYDRWKFKRPEAKKTLGKEIKEETASTSNNSNSNKAKNATSNKSNNSKEENSNNSPSPEKKEISNNNDNDNKKKNVKMSKIPGMSENLYNHLMKRINNIISKCSIPLMNVEDYKLVQKIGQGSYGIIFRAVSKKDKQQFALKKIISNKLQKISEFIKEFELVYSCHHENIMKIYSYCIRILDSTTYALYVLMELSEGDWDKEIKIRLMQGKNYTEKELINILFQLTSSLLYIEQNFHISHRDIKPQNVLVFPGGKYKMADFGEAKETKIMRQRNTLRGTELYMSPALYDGLKHELNDVSHNPFKSDVFSLGFCFIYAAALNFNLLYEVRNILDNKNINNILHKFLSKNYSENFIVLLASMLNIDESKRYDFIDIKTYIEKNFGDMIK